MIDGIVLVHGGMHTSACWASLLPYLKLPAVAVDLPGRCNRPGDLATIGLDECVSAVLEDADAAGFAKFALVGHSLGGITITETANLHPDRVTHLVYVGALVPAPGSSAAQLMLDGADMEGEMNPLDEEVARSFFGNDLAAAMPKVSVVRRFTSPRRTISNVDASSWVSILRWMPSPRAIGASLFKRRSLATSCSLHDTSVRKRS